MMLKRERKETQNTPNKRQLLTDPRLAPATPTQFRSSNAEPAPVTPTRLSAQPALTTPTKFSTQPAPATPTKSRAQPVPATPTKLSTQPAPATPTKSRAQPAPATPTRPRAQPAPATPTKSRAQPAPATPTRPRARPAPATPIKLDSRQAATATPSAQPQLAHTAINSNTYRFLRGFTITLPSTVLSSDSETSNSDSPATNISQPLDLDLFPNMEDLYMQQNENLSVAKNTFFSPPNPKFGTSTALGSLATNAAAKTPASPTESNYHTEINPLLPDFAKPQKRLIANFEPLSLLGMREFKSNNNKPPNYGAFNIYPINALHILLKEKHEANETKVLRFLMTDKMQVVFAREDHEVTPAPAHYQMTGKPQDEAWCITAGDMYYSFDKTSGKNILSKINHKSGDFTPSFDSLKWFFAVLILNEKALPFSLPKILSVGEVYSGAGGDVIDSEWEVKELRDWVMQQVTTNSHTLNALQQTAQKVQILQFNKPIIQSRHQAEPLKSKGRLDFDDEEEFASHSSLGNMR